MKRKRRTECERVDFLLQYHQINVCICIYGTDTKIESTNSFNSFDFAHIMYARVHTLSCICFIHFQLRCEKHKMFAQVTMFPTSIVSITFLLVFHPFAKVALPLPLRDFYSPVICDALFSFHSFVLFHGCSVSKANKQRTEQKKHNEEKKESKEMQQADVTSPH